MHTLSVGGVATFVHAVHAHWVCEAGNNVAACLAVNRYHLLHIVQLIQVSKSLCFFSAEFPSDMRRLTFEVGAVGVPPTFRIRLEESTEKMELLPGRALGPLKR